MYVCSNWCLMSINDSQGHVEMVTLFLGKPPRGRLPLLSAHFLSLLTNKCSS